MPTENIYLIDEDIYEKIPADYNLLEDTSLDMKDFIEIREKKLPGKKARFNNKANAETKEVYVTGLALNFSHDLSNSPLKSLLGREDIENLYLYADTIFVSEKLDFPQCNVTICCRHLVIDDEGAICTTGAKHPQPYATGKGGKDRKKGDDGEPGGTITLLCSVLENKRKNDDPVFIAKGAQGQNGEMGGLEDLEKNPPGPIRWDDLVNKIKDSDPFKEWYWPGLGGFDKNNVYYADVHTKNTSPCPLFDAKIFNFEMGDKNRRNAKSGANAIASGKGGNGGRSGDINYAAYKLIGKDIKLDTTGGEKGISELVPGGKKTEDTTYYHIYLYVHHKDWYYDWVQTQRSMQIGHFDDFLYNPVCNITQVLKAEDGKSEKGVDGDKGADGKASVLPTDKYSWLHPVLFEAMLGYAKTQFRDGERKKAEWILSQYSEAAAKLSPALKDDIRMSSLIRETDLYLRRMRQNLDYYGYPPGWMPRLSVLSNLKVLESSLGVASLIYFANHLLKQDDDDSIKAKDLDWTTTELRKTLTAAQKDIVASFAQLPAAKDEVAVIEGLVDNALKELRDLEGKVMDKVKKEQKDQAMFTGAFQILGAACALVPVGQPFVGQIGGGIMKQISKIDIHSPNPLKEGLSFAGGLSGEVGGFMEKNKAKISTAATADLTKEIDKGTKELSGFSSKADSITAEIKQAEDTVTNKFPPEELSIIREKIRVLRAINSGSSSPMSLSNDYADIIANIEELQTVLNNSKDLAAAKKTELVKKLGEVQKEKKELADSLKKLKTAKETREKNIETAGKVVKQLTDGISGIASGLQTMMVEFDENDKDVKERLKLLKDEPEFKGDFEKVYEKINSLNKKKLPVVEKLLLLEQRITEGVQRINTSLVQWSVLNDQRVVMQQSGLAPATRTTLNRMVQDSWNLLLMQCYFFTKAYEYRFLRKIDPVQHGLQKFIEDIDRSMKGKNMDTMKPADYDDLFEKALNAQLLRLATDLLIGRQNANGRVKDEKTMQVLNAKDKNADGVNILDMLDATGQASFRLQDLKSGIKGTDKWFQYRITGISFESILVELKDADVAFSFDIRHSGDSVILSAQDRKNYFFTVRTSNVKESTEKKLKAAKDKVEELPKEIDLQVQSWGAVFSGANYKAGDSKNTGIVNSSDSLEDDKLLKKMLDNYKLKEAYDKEEHPFKDSYPGGNSELTIVVSNNKSKNFKITELKFWVSYEVVK